MAATVTESTESSTPGVKTALPPGPRLLPRGLTSLILWNFPDPFLSWCRRRYGPTFRLRFAESPDDLVYLTREEDIKAAFTGDADTFRAGEGNSLLAPVMGERSVLLLDGDDHLEQRRRMLPPFHGESVQRYRDVVAEITRAEMERWPVDEPFPVHPRTTAIALEVILRAVIGVEEPDRLDALREATRKLVNLTFPILVMWVEPWLRHMPVGPWRPYVRVQQEADELLYDEIRRRRSDPRLDERSDVLSLLIREHGTAMSDTDLRDQLVTLLVAGHETTATGMAWAFERLSRNPRVLRRLEQALAEDDDKYLDAVVRETLRSRAVIFDVARRVKRPVDLGGYRLGEGVTVVPCIVLVQQDGVHFTDPDEFRPERFLEGEGGTYTWFPFGGGRRRCLGAAFATVEMKTVLKTVLSTHELATTTAPGERVRMKHITQTPARGARIALRPR